jgi:hypothetical protein
MSSEQTTRNLFKALGSSPYLLPLLNYVASSSRRYSEIEDYFRTVRRLYGYSHGLPTSKVIASNLRTLTKYDLIQKREGRWKATIKGSMILDFEKKLEPQEQTIYLWLAGRAEFAIDQTSERIAKTLQRHDFQYLNSLDSDHVMARHALVRVNAGYSEIVTMKDKEVLCGIIYPLDEARLATAAKDPLILHESDKYPDMLDFVYAHMSSRLNHPIADLEHALSGNGNLRLENEIGIANGKTKTFHCWLTDSQQLQVHAVTDDVAERLAIVRSVGYACDELDDVISVGKATKILSEEALALERELVQLEFQKHEGDQSRIRTLQVRRNQLHAGQLQ